MTPGERHYDDGFKAGQADEPYNATRPKLWRLGWVDANPRAASETEEEHVARLRARGYTGPDNNTQWSWG